MTYFFFQSFFFVATGVDSVADPDGIGLLQGKRVLFSGAEDAKAVCLRPLGWCIHTGSSYSVDIDCDGDSIPDPLCTDTGGHSGFIGSASGCTSNWPSGRCINAAAAKASIAVCLRPPGWCIHTGSSYSVDIDCDGDSIPDPLCTDTGGNSGFIGSASGCTGNWPSGSCGKNVCNRPHMWCSGKYYSGEDDCDGDGIPDPFCKDHAGNFGFIGSNGNCADNWPNGPKACQPTLMVIKKSAHRKEFSHGIECATAEKLSSRAATSQMDSSIRVANREFVTVCCSESGDWPTGLRPSCDWQDVTRPEAVAHCAGVGLRLCSGNELRMFSSPSGGFRGPTGRCKYDGHLIWSSTTCLN